MKYELATAIWLAGWAQLLVLIASALVPLRLDWRNQLAPLPTLLRQLFWVYGGFIVLAIVGLGTISVLNAEELAAGSALARSFCAFAAIFWLTRLSLQPFLAAGPYLTAWRLRAGYHLLTAWFVGIVLVFAWGAAG